MEKTVDPVALFQVIKRGWRLIAVVCGATAAVAAVVSFLVLPKWYQARTVLMPPQEKSAFSGLGMLLSRVSDLPGGISRVASGMAAINPSQYLFVVILNSRTVADSLIDKYDLEKVYKTKYRFQARKELHNHTVIDFPPEGHVVVAVEAREDPELASSLANEYVAQLNNILMERGVFTATRKRKFLENRLEETHTALLDLEDSLLVFQEKYKIIQPEEQTRGMVELITGPIKSTIEMLGMLQAEREGKLIQLRTLESVYTSRHPSVALLKTEVEELDRTIAKIRGGLTAENALELNDQIIPVSEVPGIALAYTRLFRSVKIQEEMFMLLSAQYEEARINELDDTPGAIVLDPAVVPEYKYRPKRLLNVMISTGIALIACLAYLFAASGLAGPGIASRGRGRLDQG
ncbi:MAG: hypothetical protein JXQ83_04660 [Candidatus Glassbacteria bacterium]|nr:hypothetical protein [Candidatus Glassbacteria bacterium]